MASERVAFCGLGIMGGPMAENLARAGFELAVYTRTREKAEQFAAEHGARAAASPREAAEGASVVITMVPDAPEVEDVLLGEQGAVHGLGDGALAIDMSTIAPTAARAIGERLAEDGVAFLEAPVSGSRPKAEDGTLTIMVGGEREAFEHALPLFEAMGERIVHVGPQGHAQLAKLLTNTMGAVHAVALAESVLALQARAHAQGRAPLPGRGQGDRRGTAPRLARGAALRAGRGARSRRGGLRRRDPGIGLIEANFP